jgi:hypothetical protein
MELIVFETDLISSMELLDLIGNGGSSGLEPRQPLSFNFRGKSKPLGQYKVNRLNYYSSGLFLTFWGMCINDSAMSSWTDLP